MDTISYNYIIFIKYIKNILDKALWEYQSGGFFGLERPRFESPYY